MSLLLILSGISGVKGTGTFTQLSPTALPGKRYSFLAKGMSPHTGTFTELSVTALPGKIHSFSPKRGPHTGLFTQLSVMALPGVRLTFTAKAEAIVEIVPTPPPPTISAGGGGAGVHTEARYRERKEIIRDDRELMEFITTLVQSGILDN